VLIFIYFFVFALVRFSPSPSFSFYLSFLFLSLLPYVVATMLFSLAFFYRTWVAVRGV
jgi:hypothetical protein